MIGNRPPGAEPGKYSATNTARTALQLESAYKKLSTKYMLPAMSSVSIEELAILGRLGRWAPKIDTALYKKVEEEYSKHNTISDEGVNLSENQSSRLLRRRLCIFLTTSDMPILILPKPNQEFCLVYLIYCCHIIDPGNCIGWKEDVVSCKVADMTSYYRSIYELKMDCMDAFPHYGVDVNSVFFKNAVIDLRRASVGWHRYHYQMNQNSGDMEYAKSQLDRCFKWIKAIFQSVSKLAYAIYSVSGGDMQSNVAIERLHMMMGFAFVIDFFYPAYTEAEFKLFGGGLCIEYHRKLDKNSAIYHLAKDNYYRLYAARQHDDKIDFDIKEVASERKMPTAKGQMILITNTNIHKAPLINRIPKMTVSELARTIRANKSTLSKEEKDALVARFKKIKETKPSSMVREEPNFVCQPYLDSGNMLKKRNELLDDSMAGDNPNKKQRDAR
jgi:hypothetical protein